MEFKKFCPACGEMKSIEEFGILRSSIDGLSYNCKECLRARVKKWLDNPENRKKHNRKAAIYRRTERGKATKKKYYHSEKGQEAYKRYNQETKRKKAREAVNHAVEEGKLPRVDTQKCSMGDGDCEGRIEYHHHKGYNKNHWLDVIPLCRKHHCIIDGNNYHEV